jgi:hypothetical protein
VKAERGSASVPAPETGPRREGGEVASGRFSFRNPKHEEVLGNR